MNVSQLLSKEETPAVEEASKHGYPTRSSNQALTEQHVESLNAPTAFQPGHNHGAPKKLVCFKLVLSDNVQQTARLPLKVYVSPHDTTDSIVSTTKNFYGLYEGQNISFEDDQGVELTARYENLGQKSTVYVRVRDERPVSASATALMQRSFPNPAMSPKKPWLDEPIQLQPSTSFRMASPHHSISRREAPKLDDAANGFSDSDAGSVSVSSSRRAKSDGLASAEISLENIVEGGRRKRAKFESSELPLFVPPQIPFTASMSSASPQRKMMNGNAGSPYQPNFGYPNVLPSPQSFGRVEAPPYNGFGQRLRGRSSGNLQPSRLSTNGVLPTPDPTIGGSVISDEDVALQLMRLGDPGNYSHGRLSNSTLDEILSGKAEVASSIDNSDAESELDDNSNVHVHQKRGHGSGPARKKIKSISGSAVRTYYSGESSDGDDLEDDTNDRTFKGDSDEIGPGAFAPSKGPIKPSKARTSSVTSKTGGKPRMSGGKAAKLPHDREAVPTQRKTSSASAHQHFAEDEEDLSSRPRCQRCRKSKKGCDRQRPCGRCKDAGIGIEGCVSEDEGNGRKGRYGRHMGVPVKKDAVDPHIGLEGITTTTNSSGDIGKKRKR